MSRLKQWSIIGCGGLLAVTVLLGIIGAIAGRGRTVTPTPTPTTAPIAAQPAAPTLTPLTVQATATAEPKPAPTEPPAPTQPPMVERTQIAGAGAEGVNLRAEPSTSAARVKTLRDGDVLETIGPSQDAGGRAWRNVRAVEGGETGWVAAEFVAPVRESQAAAPAAPAVSKPGGPSAEARAYIAWLDPKIEATLLASNALRDQFSAFSRTPQLIFDNEWKFKTGAALGILKATGQQMRDQQRAVPAEARDADREVRSVGADMVVAADDYIAGLDGLDAQRIQRANTRLTTAGGKMNAVAPKLRALRGE